MNESYTYYAFVSHSHRDAKWATWIQNALERYRLPSSVRKAVRKPLPKRLAPVFRDATDLGSCQLVEGLHRELEASRFLIVICSPDSAKPNAEGKHYVDHEVDYFAGLGRADRIIPVIVSGTPEESFSPKIRELDLLALDATKASRSRVLNDIVAKILGLRPDELWRRERRRQLVFRIWQGVIAAVGIFALFCGALFYWDNTRDVVECYANTVDDYGALRGLRLLSDAECRHRGLFYRFCYRGLRFGYWCHADAQGPSVFRPIGFKRILRSVSVSSSRGYGHVVGDPDVRVYHYDIEGGRVDEVLCRTASGRFLRREVLATDHGVVNGLMQYRAESMSRGAYRDSSAANKFVDNHSEVVQFLIDRDARGVATRIRYLDTFGNPVCDKNGEFGLEGVYDAAGYEVEKWYVDRRGGRFAGRDGVACARNTYENGLLVTTEILDASGARRPTSDGVSVSRFEYDMYGNVIGMRYADEERKPVPNKNGVYAMKIENDSFGYPIRKVNADKEGNPVCGADGVCQIAYVYDNKGRMTEWRAYDEHGAGVISRKLKCSGMKYEYDGRGQMNRQVFLGTDGLPMRSQSGYAEIRTSYDDNGERSSISYYDESGGTASNEDGVSKVCKVHDGRKLVEERYYGTNGLLKCGLNGGYAISRFKYDDYRGNRTEERYYDEKDRPAVDPRFGVHAHMWKFDHRGMLVEESYYGTNGLPVASVNGAVRVAFDYDENGRRVFQRGYDARGALAIGKDGVAGYDWVYDENGNMTCCKQIGGDGLPICGCAELRSEFDTRGDCIRQSWFDRNGLPTYGIAEWHKIEKLYDGRGKVLEERYYDIREEPVEVLVEGERCAKRRLTYDRFGDVSSQWFFAKGDVMSGRTTGFLGYAYLHDEDGRVVRRDRLTGRQDVELFEYDDNGRLLCHKLRDPSGGPQVMSGGWTCEERRYWENTDKVSEMIYTDERPNGEMRENVLLGGCGIVKTVRKVNASGSYGALSAYDQMGASVPLTNVAIIASILPGGQLSSFNLRNNSVICNFHEYNIGNPSDFGSLSRAIDSQKKGLASGMLTLADIKGSRIEVMNVRLKPGMLGARISDAFLPVSRYCEIKTAFETFMAKTGRR